MHAGSDAQPLKGATDVFALGSYICRVSLLPRRARPVLAVPPRRHNRDMPNIAAILKIEISRVARKEVRGEVLAIKKAVSAHRSEIAAQKRRIHELERQ